MHSASSSRRPLRPFVPSRPPGASAGGAGRGPAARAHAGEASLPALPRCTVGAPPGAAPAAGRPAPRFGGVRDVGAPPVIRRTIPGAVRMAPGAANVLEHIRSALRKAQRKILHSRWKLEASIAEVRAELASRE